MPLTDLDVGRAAPRDVLRIRRDMAGGLFVNLGWHSGTVQTRIVV